MINGLEAPQTTPAWALMFEQLSPFSAIGNVATPIVPDIARYIRIGPQQATKDPTLIQHPLIAGVIVLGWVVVPAAAGYLSFEKSDL